MRLLCPACRQPFRANPTGSTTLLECPRCRAMFPLEASARTTVAVPPPLPPLPPPAPPQLWALPTVRCWKCGVRVAESDACRREVRTARSSGLAAGFLGDLGGGGWMSDHWERVDLCPTCADREDANRQRQRRANRILALSFAALFVLFVLAAAVKGCLR